MPFPNIGQGRKIIWQQPTLTESWERKLRISKMRSNITLLHYPSAPAMPFPNIGPGRKIIWEKPTVRESGERKLENIEVAIEYFTAALTVYTRNAFPEYWAMTQHNLAGSVQ